MELIDITRELLSAPVFPGDPDPEMEAISRIAYGEVCNLSQLHASLHTGTHMDAPLHFLDGEADISQANLSVCVGECSVIELSGALTGVDLETKLPFCQPRVLIKGDVSLTQSAAFVLAQAGVRLIGVENQSVCSDQIAAVHRQLLADGIWILEGLDLSKVSVGTYLLMAAPLKIAGADGAPVRALLCKRRPSLNV